MEGIFLLKKEFAPMLNIPINQIDRRKQELYEWLKNFFDYEILDGNPIRINIKAQLGEYQPLPRKKYTSQLREERLAEAKKDYEEYTIAALGTEFKPNSKAKIARDAIKDFGKRKYSHTSKEWITRKFVKEPFDKHGETNNKQVWVCYDTYEPLDDKVLLHWRSILTQEHICEEEAAHAFYRQEQGQDVSKEKQYYKNAMDRFKEEYGFVPVLVREWRKSVEEAGD